MSRQEPESEEARFARQLKETRAALDGARPLVDHLSRMSEKLGQPVGRVPFALVGESDTNGAVYFQLRPWIPVRLTHFVLEPDTARAFELVDFNVGQSMQSPGDAGDSFALPLETFSIEYMRDDVLAKAQEWVTPIAEPGGRITIYARLRDDVGKGKLGGRAGVRFRGLAWCNEV